MIYSEAEARIPHIKRQAGEQGLAAYVRGDTVAWECSLSSISPSERIGSLCMRGVPEVTAEDAAGSTSLQAFKRFLDFTALIPQSQSLPVSILTIF